jgi:acyl carrier protein
MKVNKTEIQQQLQDFLLNEGWIESTEEFDLGNSFRGNLKFTNREMQEMFFMAENEFDILITAQEEQETETIGDLLDLIVEKKNL